MYSKQHKITLILVIALLTFMACGNSKKVEDAFKTDFKSSNNEKLNSELCALITTKEFVFSPQIKKTVDSLVHVGADINCDCEITNSYISKMIGSGYYFRKFFNRTQKTTVQVIRNPLPHFAFYTKDKNLIDFIKIYKANFNIKNNEGETLLDEAIEQESLSSMQDLLALGCKMQDIKSIRTNYIKIIDFAISNGANADKIDYNYLLRNTELLQENKTVLVIKKYNPSFKNKEINLNEMFFWNQEIVLELVTHGLDVNTNYKEMSILSKSISQNNTKLTQYILENGYNAKLDEASEYPALFAAAEKGDKPTIEKLISKGCNIKLNTVEGNVINQCALNKRNGVELAELFYLQNVPINSCGKNGTPLANAVKEENVKFIKWLFDKKLSPNIDCGNGSENPIFEAILTKNTELIKLLMNNGLDLNVKNNQGETPYEKAISHMEFNTRSNSRTEWGLEYKRIAEMLKTK